MQLEIFLGWAEVTLVSADSEGEAPEVCVGPASSAAVPHEPYRPVHDCTNSHATAARLPAGDATHRRLVAKLSIQLQAT